MLIDHTWSLNLTFSRPHALGPCPHYPSSTNPLTPPPNLGPTRRGLRRALFRSSPLFIINDITTTPASALKEKVLMNSVSHLLATVPCSDGPRSRLRTSRAGFTLIELLVVIAIIAVLIAPPAARRPSRPRGGPPVAMRQQPEATRPCVAQLRERQLGLPVRLGQPRLVQRRHPGRPQGRVDHEPQRPGNADAVHGTDGDLPVDQLLAADVRPGDEYRAEPPRKGLSMARHASTPRRRRR